MNGLDKRRLIIFGGTGDLTFRKLLPALYDMIRHHHGDMIYSVVALGRKTYSQNAYHEQMKSWIEKMNQEALDEKTYSVFKDKVQYLNMDILKADDYLKLVELEENDRSSEVIIYYAVSPDLFKPISNNVIKIRKGLPPIKVMVEKPFGKTLEEAKYLSECLERCFGNEHVFRIDHYLGKEMIRSIETIRFENPLFEQAWNHQFIHSVEINALESLGIENRGSYYDQAGALKDMVQNHLFQIMTLIAMEKADDEDDIADKQVKVLKKLRNGAELNVQKSMVLGQYEGYLDEKEVSRDSTQETYVELELFIDNDRWHEVPFYIKTGKKMGQKEMSITINFKNTNPNAQRNSLVINVFPTEEVNFSFNIKKPGSEAENTLAHMNFCQSCVQEYRINTKEAYERLLLAAFDGDSSWFAKWDQIELSWKYVDGLKKAYHELKLPLYRYKTPEDLPKIGKK